MILGWQDFHKPARRAAYITKGRDPNANEKGKRQERMAIYQPTVTLARATGWRCHELLRMKSGYMVLKVREKGG